MLQSMGLESDPTVGGLGFIDTYGTSFGRDIEPTVEGGSKMYQLMTSCLRVFRSGAGECRETSELCCQGDFESNPVAFSLLQGNVSGRVE